MPTFFRSERTILTALRILRMIGSYLVLRLTRSSANNVRNRTGAKRIQMSTAIPPASGHSYTPLVIIQLLRPVVQAAKAFGRVEAFGTVAVAVDAHVATACTPSIGQVARTLDDCI